MRLPDSYNYSPSRFFRFSSAAAKDTVIIHFVGPQKPHTWFRRTYLMNPSNINEPLCQFLVLDRYFEMLGKEVQQSELDKLPRCNSSSSSRRTTVRLPFKG